jgi:ATP-dependent DNA helicase RecQ
VTEIPSVSTPGLRPEHDPLSDALKEHFGHESFRSGQREIIDAILEGRDAFALLPTGGGKSLTYQLPAVLLPGLTLVVSPLIALMHDQIERLSANGIAATDLTSGLDPDEYERRAHGVLSGVYRLLYVAPERLATSSFLGLIAAIRERQGIALLAVDEAHCVSEWGHDFRPEYRQIGKLRAHLGNAPVLALTATATERVRGDIATQLGVHDPFRWVGSFNRPNLVYEVQSKDAGTHSALLRLLDSVRERRSAKRAVPSQLSSSTLPQHPNTPAIVYCQTRATVERVCARLTADGVHALPYHAGLALEERRAHQDAFVRDRVPVLVATIAFGMGIAKPDVRLVVHLDAPRTLEAYYQESGRAGRDGDPARCVLFASLADRVKAEYFITQMADPERQRLARSQYGQVMAYCATATCRRSALLAYFGETYGSESCGACDNCLRGSDLMGAETAALEDRTTDAQKLLSAVARTGERFGLRYVIDVLRAAGNHKIVERGHDQLSVYGVGAAQSVQEWQRVGQHLLLTGALALMGAGDPRYPVLRLTRQAWEILRGQRPFFLASLADVQSASGSRGTTSRHEREGGGSAAVPLDAHASALFQRLRVLRRELADERNVPPYVIFSDATLREMAHQRPGNRTTFTQISGVGSQKLEAFATSFLRAIESYCDEHGLATMEQVELAVEKPKPRIGREQLQRTDHVTNDAPGERTESARSVRTAQITWQLFQEGKTVDEIAEARGLAARTIVDHLCAGLTHGEAIDLDRLVAPQRQATIRAAIRASRGGAETDARPIGDIRLRPLKERLESAGERDVTYDAIRLVLAVLSRQSPDT